MIAKTLSATVKGINAHIVNVETDTVTGLPGFDIVGLPDSTVRESKERVKAALRNSDVMVGSRRITVNLSPGDLKKEGTQFDLPMAVAIAVSIGAVRQKSVDGYVFIGELSLDGKINPVRGVLSIIYEAKNHGIKSCIIPMDNKDEAALVDGINIFPAEYLHEVISHLLGQNSILRVKITGKEAFGSRAAHAQPDFADVKGQESVKRAFAIAAAGQHNILVTGPPGVGKTMIAQRLPSIMPALTFEESIEVTKIFSVKGIINDNNSLISDRPFRSTHHTLSRTSLIGGGNPPSPGEISLAHFGVLFLDEIVEYPRTALEALRQPMEDKEVVISRVGYTVTYPSNFMLVAASNPCPCGYAGVKDKCKCTLTDIEKYMGKMSGPMMDRIDIHIETEALQYDDLHDGRKTSTSKELRERVSHAIDMQRERFKADAINFNAHMDTALVERYCILGHAEGKMLKGAFESLGLSGRAYHRILKLARTIADYEQSESISYVHLTEAIQYRNIDRTTWQK